MPVGQLQRSLRGSPAQVTHNGQVVREQAEVCPGRAALVHEQTAMTCSTS